MENTNQDVPTTPSEGQENQQSANAAESVNSNTLRAQTKTRAGKARAFTKTYNIVEKYIGNNRSKRLLRSYREKFDVMFTELQKLNEEISKNTADENEFEEVCSWLVPYEEKYEIITSSIDDELDQRADEAPTLSTFARSAIENLQISEQGENNEKIIPPEINCQEPIDDEINENVQQENKSIPSKAFDDWVDTGNVDTNNILSKPTAELSDTLVGLNLRLDTFDGEPLKYQGFMTSFKHQVHDRQSFTSCAKMAHLLNHLSGPAKLAVEGFPVDERGYLQSLKVIKDLFGNKALVSRAYIDRVTKGPQISLKDNTKIRTFYHELFACLSALERMNYWDDINSSSTLIDIVKRLPFKSQERWKQRVVSIRRSGVSPTLKNVVDFVKNESLAATDPVWGDFNNASTHATTKSKPSRVFATITNKTKCIFCDEEGHNSWHCKTVSPSHDERHEKVRSAKACFNCLRTGHMVAKCQSKYRCSICNKKHHTMLHNDEKPPASNDESNTSVSASAVKNGTTYLQILPVEVFGPNGSAIANALLDTGSQVTILSTKLANVVGLKGEKATLELTTVNGKSSPKQVSMVELTIKGINQRVEHSIQQVYVDKAFTLPCNTLQVQDIQTYPHLKDIKICKPIENQNVDLLIGANASEILLPLECRRGKPEDPIAVKTPLGWTIFGGVSNNLRNSANPVFVGSIYNSLDEQLKKFWETEEFGCKFNLEKEFSQQDLRAKKILDEAKIVNKHYEVGLLWKKPDVKLPNNKQYALSRLTSVKRRFEKDIVFKDKYTKVVEGYISEGHATKLENDKSFNDRTWNLPYHAVTNINKPGKFKSCIRCCCPIQGCQFK